MYSGVSGLRVHQTKMDVIGNNIANVNTIGFKRSTTNFQEIFNQTIRGAGSPQGGRGGTNPQQIGLGVNLASITVNHSKGSTQNTGYVTDLMIDGNGFFILSNDENAQNRFYTRAGNFVEDKHGFLVATNGYKVLDQNMKPIQINKSETKAATQTSGIELNGNINYNDLEYTTTVDVYDSLGDVHTLTIKFTDLIPTTTETPSGNEVATATNGSIRKMEIFDEDGGSIYGATNRYVQFDTSGSYVGLLDQSYAQITANEDIVLDIPGADKLTLVVNDNMFLDNNNNAILKQTSNTSDAKGVQLQGNAAGTIDDFTISANGEVVGIFTNGERKTLATIGLADFDNPAGLLKLGGNMFIDTPNSGTPKTGAPSTGSFGDLNPGALEMSNVDLSLEFTDMISTQRGFQANSRIITTTDEMLQELVNLKR